MIDPDKWAGLRAKQRKLNPELTAELHKDILTSYKQLKNIRAVARLVNRSVGYVHKVLKAADAPTMPVGRPWPSKREPLSTERVPKHEKLQLHAIEEILTRPLTARPIRKTTIKKEI